jgi:hypothetical protein
LGRLWAGRIFGTNTGNVFIELDGADEKISGALHLSDDRFGLSVFSISGTFDGANLKIGGTEKAAGGQTGTFRTKATLTP